jgi:hypothetical protein
MKSAPGGDRCPTTTITWPIASQGVAAAAGITLGPVALNGARVANSSIHATTRGAPPVTAGGVGPELQAYCPADDTVVVLVSNPSAAPLVATGADIVVDVLALPLAP